MLIPLFFSSIENRHQGHKLAMVDHTCNSSTQEAEVGGPPWVPGQHVLHRISAWDTE